MTANYKIFVTRDKFRLENFNSLTKGKIIGQQKRKVKGLKPLITLFRFYFFKSNNSKKSNICSRLIENANGGLNTRE